jgi:hypothetical protein
LAERNHRRKEQRNDERVRNGTEDDKGEAVGGAYSTTQVEPRTTNTEKTDMALDRANRPTAAPFAGGVCGTALVLVLTSEVVILELVFAVVGDVTVVGAGAGEGKGVPAAGGGGALPTTIVDVEDGAVGRVSDAGM